MKNYNKCKTSIAFLIFGLSASCATMFGNTDREVHVNSEPPGANIYVNGVLYAKTPGKLLLPDAGYHTHKIVIVKPGFESSIVYVHTKFQDSGYLNILMPPGFFIDYASDTMFALESKDLNQDIVLKKESVTKILKKSVTTVKVK